MAAVLTTARLVLRRPHEGDLPVVAELNADPEVMRHLTGRPMSLDESRAELRRHIARREPDAPGRLMADLADTGETIGWFALTTFHDDPGPAPEGLGLGYRLLRRFWGRGFATEGTLALVDAAFTVHDADRVHAETMAVNVRSRRVMERCGLRHVRTFHLDWDEPLPGAERGDVEYALTRERWADARRAPTRRGDGPGR